MKRGFSPLSKDERRRRRVEYFVIIAAFAALAGLYLLERNLYRFSVDVKLPHNMLVFMLINVNLLLLLLLLFFLIRNIIKLVIERRSRIAWSKLRTRLVVGFSLFSLVPTALLFFLTTGMVKRSVEDWFKGQVNNAMRRSVEVVQTYYRESQDRALHFAQMAAERVHGEGLLELEDDGTLDIRMHELRRTFGLWGLELYGPDFNLLASSLEEGAPIDIARFAFPFADAYASEDGLSVPTLVETFAGQDMARGFSPVFSGGPEKALLGYVVANVAIQENLLKKMGQVSQAYDEYNRIRTLQSPLKTSFIFSLIMVFAMVILLSTWVGLHLSKAISEPIQALARATAEISQGNLDVRVPPAGDDEIGTVVDSFNTMTSELAAKEDRLQQANRALKERNAEVESSKSYIEAVLASVAAGIISFDGTGHITTVNAIAAETFDLDRPGSRGLHYSQVLNGKPLELLHAAFETLHGGVSSVQRQWVLSIGEEVKTLLISLTAMHSEAEEPLGAVLVFDDLTELVTAQRAAAWREVARRIAHEIKNPLTPIQLSAQRLRKRYLARFENEDTVFDEATRVIIEQVETMKTLVNEFSQFARMPHAMLAPHDLNHLVAEVVALYRQAHREIDFVYEPDADLPLVDLDREQVKRVVVNLLDNAVAAMQEQGKLVLRTRYHVEMKSAQLEVADSGPGIPVEDRQRIFEPYFSTKQGGTGLGLSIVKKIMEDHHAYIRVQSNVPEGALFSLEFPVAGDRTLAVA